MLSENKYLVDFLMGFSGKKPQTLLIPIPYYMISTAVSKRNYRIVENLNFPLEFLVMISDNFAKFVSGSVMHCYIRRLI